MNYKCALKQTLKKQNKTETINEIDTTTIIEIDAHTNKPKNSQECPVCYDCIKSNNYIVTKCNHIFCNDCLFNALSKNSCCPMCRQEIFTFKNKIKDLTQDDVNSLEIDLDDFKNQVSFKLINELKKSLIQILEENNIVSSEMKNNIKNFLNNNEINKKLNSSFYNLIKKIFSIISITSYENLHNWLRNKN